MKKLLFLTLMLAAAPFAINAASADDVIAFIDIVQTNKDDWFDYSKEFHDAKLDLMKKQHDEMFEQKKEHIKKFEQGGDMSNRYDAKLKDMIAMQKRHAEEWKALCDKYRTKAEELYNQNKDAITKFENNLAGVKDESAMTSSK